MANESAQVYNEYENALDATKIQRATLNTDGTINYVDATWTSMKDAGYDLRFEGKVVVDNATAANFDAAGSSKDYFIALQTGRVTTNNQEVNGVTEIYTADQLMAMTPGKNYRLMSDIDLSGKNWTPIELTSGTTFDGNGHSINNLNNSLFSTIYGTVTNLHIEGNVTNTSTNHEYGGGNISTSGMLAGIASNGANINNVTVSGTVDTQGSKTPTGGMIGYILNTTGTSDAVTISNCSANVVVKSGESAGGLIGGAEIPGTVVQNCSTSGTIYGSINAGGLIGFGSNMTITNSSSSAEIHQYGNNRDNASWWIGGEQADLSGMPNWGQIFQIVLQAGMFILTIIWQVVSVEW